MDTRQEELRRRLGEVGFDEVRFATLASGHDDGLRAWLDAGLHGEMGWMERTADKRIDPQLVLPGACSAIMLGISYAEGGQRDGGVASPTQGVSVGERAGRPTWARYALNEDYHDTVKPGLIAAGRIMQELYGIGERDYRYYVDTGPVLERGWAARAGIGFVGKNAMLISRRHGNWLLLAAILTKVAFVADEPIRKKVENLDTKQAGEVGLLCGKCTRCLDACPTDAFVKPGVVDARRCVSYQTIENKGVIPRELRAGIGQRIYGCDVCLEVCPWNRFAQEGRKMLLSVRGDIAELELREILGLTPVRFAEVFRRTAIKRVKLGRLLRNACVVAGNSGDTALLPPLVELARAHDLALVRAHAVWAVYRLGGRALLAGAEATETDATVLAEYAAEAGPVT